MDILIDTPMILATFYVIVPTTSYFANASRLHFARWTKLTTINHLTYLLSNL